MDHAAQNESVLDASTQCCSRCGKSIRRGWAFEFKPKSRATLPDHQGTDSQVTKCFSCALKHQPMLRRSLMAALLVGTILTALNQGDNLLSGQLNAALFWKIPLTYCVPFIVATYGAITNSRQ